LSPQTSLGDLVRAIMEGVAFSLYDVTRLLERQGITPSAFRLSGGGSQSGRWRQIFAHVFNRPISTAAASSEGTAFGAALLAGIGQGRWTASGELKHLMPPQTFDEPDSALAPRYRALFDVYRRGYDSLAPLFRDLAAVK
jgi:xylulokinase